jgi:hypothetical protein
MWKNQVFNDLKLLYGMLVENFNGERAQKSGIKVQELGGEKM